MKTDWDYTKLAKSYLKRPDYSQRAIDRIIQLSGVLPGDEVCDMGAGAGHLTIKLLEAGLRVMAVEPNSAMREQGMKRTDPYPHIKWREATAEESGLADSNYSLVTFGSSFNVVDRTTALKEVRRIARPGGCLALLWNHRDMDDPIQAELEAIIKNHVRDYTYGSRRAEQKSFLEESGFFVRIDTIEEKIKHRMSVRDCIEAWRSHATLERQSGGGFDAVIADMQKLLDSLRDNTLIIPYTTRAWVAKLKDKN